MKKHGDRAKAKGQTAVVFTLVIVALLGTIALCTDVGTFYMNWEEMQKAADAAVLAGANFLPSTPSTAISTAQQYAQMNGIQASEVTNTQVSSNNMQIELDAQRTVPYYFGKVLGLTSQVISVRAVAGLEASQTATGLVPIGIQQGSYTLYQQMTIHLPPQNQTVGPGNWEPLAMGNCTSCDPGGSNYKYNIEYGYQSPISINDYIYTEPGQLNGPTQQGINYRLNQASTIDPSGTDTNHTLNDPRMIEVPIVNFNNVNGSGAVQVLGFAELWIISVDGSGDITVEFINQVVANNVPSPGTSCWGACAPVLMQ
jgi:hypothetical protein